MTTVELKTTERLSESEMSKFPHYNIGFQFYLWKKLKVTDQNKKYINLYLKLL